MHVVLWTAAGQRYATRTGQIVEVIAPVEARPVPESPPWVRGSINYRGQLISLFDVPRLLGHNDWPMRMASRILVVEIEASEDSEASNECEASKRNEDTAERLAALLVQSVLGSEELDFTNRAERPSPSSPCCEFLGPIALTDAGAVQLTFPERIGWKT